jgi:hypothetical protein
MRQTSARKSNRRSGACPANGELRPTWADAHRDAALSDIKPDAGQEPERLTKAPRHSRHRALSASPSRASRPSTFRRLSTLRPEICRRPSGGIPLPEMRRNSHPRGCVHSSQSAVSRPFRRRNVSPCLRGAFCQSSRCSTWIGMGVQLGPTMKRRRRTLIRPSTAAAGIAAIDAFRKNAAKLPNGMLMSTTVTRLVGAVSDMGRYYTIKMGPLYAVVG